MPDHDYVPCWKWHGGDYPSEVGCYKPGCHHGWPYCGLPPEKHRAASTKPAGVTTRVVQMRCHCGRGVTIGNDPWCEGCNQSAATCDCASSTEGA